MLMRHLVESIFRRFCCQNYNLCGHKLSDLQVLNECHRHECIYRNNLQQLAYVTIPLFVNRGKLKLKSNNMVESNNVVKLMMQLTLVI